MCLFVCSVCLRLTAALIVSLTLWDSFNFIVSYSIAGKQKEINHRKLVIERLFAIMMCLFLGKFFALAVCLKLNVNVQFAIQFQCLYTHIS